MAKKTTTTSSATYRRQKTRFGSRLRKQNALKQKTVVRQTGRTKDLDVIATETDPQVRQQMYRDYQRGQNIRAGLRNVTTQAVATGAQIGTSVRSANGQQSSLAQNIMGGAQTASNTRDEDKDDKEGSGGSQVWY